MTKPYYTILYADGKIGFIGSKGQCRQVASHFQKDKSEPCFNPVAILKITPKCDPIVSWCDNRIKHSTGMAFHS